MARATIKAATKQATASASASASVSTSASTSAPTLTLPPQSLSSTTTNLNAVAREKSELRCNWRKDVKISTKNDYHYYNEAPLSNNNYLHSSNDSYDNKVLKKCCIYYNNNYYLPPAFAFSRQLVYAAVLILVFIVNDCCCVGDGADFISGSESLARAEGVKADAVAVKTAETVTAAAAGLAAEEHPLQRRHATTKENNIETDDANLVFVNKCCEKFEIHVDGVCAQVNESDYFQPMFTNYQGVHNVDVKFKFVIGIPACGTMQTWPIYHYQGSADQLVLLDDGKLRHYTNSNEDEEELYEHTDYDSDLDDERKSLFHDYAQGHYCIDKAISSTGQHRQILYANICLAKKEIKWSDSTFLLRKIINPIFHIISLIMLLLISIIYFILPTLRDLVGNIITTIAVCLMAAQAADIVRIFTEFTNHVSFIVADIILYISLLGAFFWLNSFGYYIWKTFRSRNVFLRVTDGRKYCYYSAYAWGLTALMAGLAVFAHFFLDAESYKEQNLIGDQETIGWLGIWIFFAPIACTILINIFFYVTTLKLINRRNVYGRIQHKLRANFIMFSWMLLIMSITWLFFVLSWLPYDGLLYVHILVNAMQAPLLLYVCVLMQKHVTFLLKKSCCYNEPPSANDWGDEMHYMNCNDY